MPSTRAKPRIALTLGDPAGIGPEVGLKALGDASIRARMRLLVIGPAALRPAEVPLAKVRAGAPAGEEREFCWLATEAPSTWKLGEHQAECGRAALAALRAGHELALAGHVAALVTCPVSKTALHLAGERVEGQTELLGRWCGVERFEMLAVAGALRVMLLTRHMPLRQAIESITAERVLDRLSLLDSTLKRLRIPEPRLALAGLNPHAGEGGLLGCEEAELLAPAVESARQRGLRVTGPVSPDSVFLQAARGRFDGVLALYHDQAFIPIKFSSPDGSLTLIAGLPYLRVSPAHGTAFEIAGKGVASAANLISALHQAAEWTATEETSRVRAQPAADDQGE